MCVCVCVGGGGGAGGILSFYFLRVPVNVLKLVPCSSELRKQKF